MVKSKWTPISEQSFSAVAIANFDSNDIPYSLCLLVGDKVCVQREFDDWYLGHIDSDSRRSGIFPKNHVHIKPCLGRDKSLKNGGFDYKGLDMAQEISETLREWSSSWKQLFLQRSKEFETIRNRMYELIDLRQTVMSNTLTVDELRTIKQTILSKINVGNSILGLDMVVWDENPLPQETSAINLYHVHETISRQVKKGMAGLNTVPEVKVTDEMTDHSLHFSLYVTVNNCTCNIGEDADILVTLYDANENYFISENYVVQWSSQGLMKEFAKLSKARVIFSELGAKDIAREKVFIVCQIIRRGAMELKENESNHKNHSLHTMRRDVSSKQNEIIRRPFGVAAIDITDVLKVKASTDDEKQFFVPFMQCLEKDSLDSIMRKVVSVRGGEISEKEHKGQGLWISYRLLVGDLDQARCDYPQLVSPFTQIARRMGFPEIILPDDVRNDLYVTLVSGEFSHKAYAKNAKNIEATVKCFDSSGNLHSSALTIGPGLPPGPEYKSVVYYHEEKPKWMETFKICLDFDELPCAHLKISFKHRSSNESKDRNEKPFAFCFIRLQNENETTLQDGIHELNVYKIDRKKYDESETNIQYLHSLPATRKELEAKNSRSSHSSSKSSLLSNNNVNVPGLSLIPADVCTISSLLCSTKLTQNIDLLGLLRYKTDCADDSDLKSCLLAFMKVDGAEIVQFLTDILDSLFNILQSRDSEEFMDLVFQSLVFIVSLLSDAKYQQFRKTLDRYIQRTFSFSSAYIKLIFVLKRYVDNLSSGRISSNFSFSSTYSDLRHSSLGIQDQEWIPNFMKSLEYLFKFIVKSRWLFLTLNNTSNKSGMNFHDSMQHLLVSFTNLMSDRSKASLEVQQMCLQYFPTALSDIILVFDKEILSEILTALLNNVPFEKLKKEKLLFMLDVIQCDDLFSDRQARTIILPVFNEYLRHFLEKHIETSSCVKVLSEILLALHQRPPQDIVNDVNDLMKSILTTVIFSVIKRKKDDVITKNLVAILIDILRLMTSAHYKGYIESFEERHDLLNFLIQVFMLFKDLVNSPIFPKDWAEMLFLQNQVILSSIKEFAEEIRNRFCEDNFVYQLWNNFFHCAISFLLQESLQSEDFSFYKRNRMTKKYGDMRRELASVIRKMWFHFSKHAKDFVPHMIEPFLEMALIPDRTLREEIIPIFFEMMQCEFYTEIEEKRPGNFNRCKEEMISQLDKLFEAHRGDEDFRQLFKEEMLKKFEGHSHMKDKVEFVGILSTLMKRLLEHRAVSSDELENVECQMICLFNLLEFFRQNDCGKLYLRYLYKLLDLNITNGFHAEAAHTLYLHAKCLEWSDNPVPPHYRTEKYPNCKTQRELKETLVRSMIDHFEKGQQREEAIVICQELIVIHERDILNYEMLAELYQKMSTLYADIVKQPQFKREYYRVGYYGQGFPAFLRNRAFIHRGKDYERLSDFTKRLTDYFPQAKRLDQTSVVRKEIMDSSDQYLQINSVDPSIKLPEKFQGKLLPPYTLLFYENNRVHEFSCSRIFKRESQNSDCEISTIWVERITMKTKHPLPHISPCLQVIETKSKELSPIEIAIEDLEKKLDELIRELSCYHFNLPNQNISSLLQKIQGVVDAPVNGGIEQYEKAFLSPDFMACRDPYLTLSQREGFTRHLKHLILSLIPLIDIAFNLIKPGIQPSFQPLCEHLINSYRKMKLSTERKYKKTDFSLSPKLRQAIEEFSQKGLTTSPDPEKLDRSSFTRSVGKGRLRSGFGHKSGIWNSSVSTPSLNPISNTFNSVRNIRKNGFSKIGQANKEGTKWFDGDRASSISAKDSEEDLFRPARSFRPRSSGPISCPNGDLYLSSTNLRSPNSRHSDEPDMALSLPTSPPSLPPKRSSNDLSLRRNENITQYHTYVRPRKNSLPTQKRPLPPYPQRPLDKSPTEQSHEQ